MSVGGYGTQMAYGNAPTPSGTTSWTNFANVIDIKNAMKIVAKDIDTSTLTSPGEFETSAPGWAKGDNVEMKIQFDKSQNATVYGLFRQPLGYKITFPDGTQPTTGSQWLWPGYINGFGNEVDRENLVTADITVKVAGQPVFIPAS